MRIVVALGGNAPIVWALASDRVKLLAYRILDPTGNTGEDTDTEPGEPIYHDNCTDHRRRCDSCAQHDQQVTVKQ